MKIKDVSHNIFFFLLVICTIFGILESVDQHNLNKFFIRKMRDLAGICCLHCVSCSTVELFYEVVMLHFLIGGFQSLSTLGSVLVGMFLKAGIASLASD